MIKFSVVIALILSGWLTCCGEKKYPAEPRETDKRSLLAAEYQNRLDAWPDSGWPSERDCDGSLWAGKAVAAGIDTVDLRRAFDKSWRPYRRPTHDCYKEYKEKGQGYGSKSSVSNDMLLGIAWGVWANRDYDASSGLLKYARDNNYIMGEADTEAQPRVVMSANNIILWSSINHNLSEGRWTNIWYNRDPSYFKVNKDYQGHLSALGIFLYWDLMKHRPQRMAAWDEVIAHLRYTWPDVPLYAALDGIYTGRMDTAIDMLLDKDLEPPEYARGYDAERIHEVEWLFTAKRVLEYLNEHRFED